MGVETRLSFNGLQAVRGHRIVAYLTRSFIDTDNCADSFVGERGHLCLRRRRKLPESLRHMYHERISPTGERLRFTRSMRVQGSRSTEGAGS